MKFPVTFVDAFTDRPFGGNPAAVVLLDHWPDDALLQAIAAEHNLSETAFVVPEAEVSRLRWFTPKVEIGLCGHATLATAHVLFQTSHADQTEVRFTCLSGELAVRKQGDLLFLDFPAWPGKPVEPTDAIVDALGGKPVDVLAGRDLLAVFETEREVREFSPDFDKIAALDQFALIVTAPGDEVDFVSRFFAPKAGIPEDPVTGSAHLMLTPYWAERLEKSVLSARQLSQRGGELSCELKGDRVLIGGKVVEYLKGKIFV